MSNMGYCRFQNTLSDLRDCLEALEDGKPLSPEEFRAATRLREMCEEILDENNEPVAQGDWDDEDDDEDDDLLGGALDDGEQSTF
jgi:exonuclease VII small subunit